MALSAIQGLPQESRSAHATGRGMSRTPICFAGQHQATQTNRWPRSIAWLLFCILLRYGNPIIRANLGLCFCRNALHDRIRADAILCLFAQNGRIGLGCQVSSIRFCQRFGEQFWKTPWIVQRCRPAAHFQEVYLRLPIRLAKRYWHQLVSQVCFSDV